MAVARASSGTQFVVLGSYVTQLDLTTLTVSAGDNRALFSGIVFGDGGAGLPTSISANWDQAGTPQAMSAIGTLDTSTGDCRLQMAYLVAPTTGNKTLRYTWTNAGPATLGAAAFSDVHQTTPYITSDNVTATGTGTAAASGAITCTTDDATLALVGSATGAGTRFFTTPENFTSEWRQTTNGETAGSMTSNLGGTSNDHTFTLNASDAWAVMGIHINATDPWVPQVGAPEKIIVRASAMRW